MRRFTIKKYDGKLNNGFYAIKRLGKTIAHIEDKEDAVIFHAIDKKVKLNRREG